MTKQRFQEGDLVKVKASKDSPIYKISCLDPDGFFCYIKAVNDGPRAVAQPFDTDLLVKCI